MELGGTEKEDLSGFDHLVGSIYCWFRSFHEVFSANKYSVFFFSWQVHWRCTCGLISQECQLVT